MERYKYFEYDESDKYILDTKTKIEYSEVNKELTSLLNERNKQIESLTELRKFAIEELKKLKAEFVNNISPVKLSYTEYVEKIFDKINNRIKELEGEIIIIMDEKEIIEYLDSILDSSSVSTSIISDNKLKLYVDGLGTFELTVNQISED